MPKMKPILFNTEMVRAILDGRKTVTRRVCKITVNGGVSVSHNFCETCCYPEVNKDGICVNFFNADKIYVGAAKPPCQPGDILYVRETWNTTDDCGLFPPWPSTGTHYMYLADAPDSPEAKEARWRPSIHMPKEAARIFLRVTNVRVERLQDITAEECVREGILKESLTEVGHEFTRGQFEDLWNSTIPRHPNKFKRYLYYWQDNPWVWVIEFERINREDI